MTVKISTVLGSGHALTPSDINTIEITTLKVSDNTIVTLKNGGFYVSMTSSSAEALCYALFDIMEEGFKVEKSYSLKAGDKLIIDKSIRGYLFVDYDKKNFNKCSIKLGPTGGVINQIDLHRISIDES